jgi:hypothetical protein
MANKDTMQSSRSGILDFSELTVTHINKKDGGETVFDLKETLQRYDGLDVTISVKVDSEPKAE